MLVKQSSTLKKCRNLLGDSKFLLILIIMTNKDACVGKDAKTFKFIES